MSFCKRPDISGHLYELKKGIGAIRNIGRVDTHDWWVRVLAENKIGGKPTDFQGHFARVCECIDGDK